MTNSIFKLSISVVLLTLVGYLYYDKFYVEEPLSQHLIDIHNEIASINTNICQVHHDYLRVGHYISGHDFRHATHFCPECSLIEELDRRDNEITEEIVSLSAEANKVSKDSDEYKKLSDRINKLHVEQGLLKKHIYSADERAIEVNKIMRNVRVVGGKFEPHKAFENNPDVE